jgi:putative ABC transport system ATP-binding protein
MSYVVFDNVRKVYKAGEVEIEALRDAAFQVEKGETAVIVGASGAGKTTLLNILGGMDTLTSGHVFLDGKEISAFSKKELTSYRRHDIGFVFQFYNLVQNLNVEDNILLPSSVKGKSKSEMKAQLDEILKITGLTEKRKAKPSELSGGQQQRVAIARAVIGNPEIILADEPTGNLDSNAGAEIMNLFSEINKKKGITILQVTHSHKCAAYGGRVVELINGRTDIQPDGSIGALSSKTE